MSITSKTQKVRNRLIALGVLPQDASDLAITILRWTESGDEWTVKRLKALKLEFITTILAHDTEPILAPWVSRDSSGVPKGALKRLWTHEYYLKSPQVVLNALMAYSTFVSSEVTDSQLSKFINSARAEPVQSGWFRRMRTSPLWETIDEYVVLNPGIASYSQRFRSPVKRVPTITGTSPEIAVEADLEFASQSLPIREAYDMDDLCYPMEFAIPYTFLSQWRKREELHPWVGTISFIQEAGYKLRAVANPNRVVQTALEPLKRELGDVLEQIYEDCTFDQEKGVAWCQWHLKQGDKLFSVDLSDATNLFPLQAQMEALRGLEDCQEHTKEDGRARFRILCDLFQHFATSPWRLPNGDKLLFTKGQPLGLGPSFFVFSLAHHALLYSLGGKGKYVILGDDIVIRTKSLYDRYVGILTSWGCTVSKEKTIASRHVAEFASRLIRPTDVLRQWKWRSITRANVIDVCRQHGPRFASEVPTSMRKVIEAIAPIPKSLGGLGWNPRGLPLDARLSSQVGQQLLSLLGKEKLLMMRSAKSIMGSDFVSAHNRLWLTPDEREDFLPVLKVKLPSCWQPFLPGDYSAYADLLEDWDSKVLELWSSRPHLGELIACPDKQHVVWELRERGYLPWMQAPNPWKNESSGLYRSISRLLRGLSLDIV